MTKKVGRPARAVRIPMTTISISEKIFQEMCEVKKSQETWYDFLNRVFQQWKTTKTTIESNKILTDENNFLVYTLEQTQRKCQEYVEVIEAMKADHKELTSPKKEVGYLYPIIEDTIDGLSSSNYLVIGLEDNEETITDTGITPLDTN